MEPLSHRQNVGHKSNSYLPPEYPYEMHQPGKCSRIDRAAQSAGFEPFEDNVCDQADVSAREPRRHHEFERFKTVSGPRRVEIRVTPGREGRDCKTECERCPRIR